MPELGLLGSVRGALSNERPYRECGKSHQSDSFAACAALESDMTHISGFERSQLLLLPEAIDDYVVADNPVRFIDAFVDGLDLAAAGFKRVTPNVTGRPGYAPGDLLKLSIYGYLNRVRSSRRLEAECHRMRSEFDQCTDEPVRGFPLETMRVGGAADFAAIDPARELQRASPIGQFDVERHFGSVHAAFQVERSQWQFQLTRDLRPLLLEIERTVHESMRRIHRHAPMTRHPLRKCTGGE